MGNSRADVAGVHSPTVEVERIVPSGPAPLHWGMILVPGGPGGEQLLPDDALHVYARLAWRAPLDGLRGELLRVTTARQWISVGAQNTEVADLVTAWQGVEEVASALLVNRTVTGVPDAAFGVRSLPPAPQVRSEVAYGDVVVERSRVTTFAATSGITHPLHLDLERSRQAGFDDLVVQGLELLDDVVRAAGPATSGVSAWFRRPVVAGQRLTMFGGAGNSWVIRAGGEIAVLAQIDAHPAAQVGS